MICIPTGRIGLGRIAITPSAIEAINAAGQKPARFLRRHSVGDWGEICSLDKFLDDSEIVRGERMLSAYRTALGDRLFVVTEPDRRSTTIMMAEEF